MVRPQDTLYGIAWRHNLDYRELAKWNNIGGDYKLTVGQVLVLQPGGGRQGPPRAAASPAPVVRAPMAGAPLVGAPVVGAPVVGAPVVGAPVKSAGSAAHGGSSGAAAPGRVVYTGSGLRGYDNLIIIKHGDSLLSSYAHNREMLVHEGQDVAAGQVIAHMGTGPHQISALYFEIRVNGKPVDPLRYLSASR